LAVEFDVGGQIRRRAAGPPAQHSQQGR
jgi:hypothetical protein